MKKYVFALSVLLGSIGFSSCGDNTTVVQDSYNEVFELRADFSANNNYEQLYAINPALRATDHVLVYRLWGTTDSGKDVWRLIPNVVYLQGNEEIIYNFDHSQADIRLFLDPSFDLMLLNAQEQQSLLVNQIFRVIVLEGTFNAKMDFSDYEKTIKYLGLENAKITRLNSK